MAGAAPSGGPPADAILGIFAREGLSAALVSIHRAGFGPNARVLDPTRGDVGGQLRRTGFAPPAGFVAVTSEKTDALILVTAPGRAASIGQTFAGLGAHQIYLLHRDAVGRGGPAPTTIEHLPTDVATQPLEEQIGASQ